ncbi:SRL1, partial [Symbiodinium necroappetens]
METRFPDVGFRVGPLLLEGLSAKPITPRRILLWNSLSLSQPRRGLICRLRHFGYTPCVAAGHEAPLDPTEIQENKSFKKEPLRDSQPKAPRFRLQGIPNLPTRETQRRPVQPPAPPEPAKKEDILRNVAHNATLTSIEPDTWTPDRDLCERPKEEKPPAPPEEDSELIRCHLHRKPQLSCKICRRVYYSAVDPNSQKKDDKKGSDRKPEDEAPGAADSILLEARMRGAEAFEITNKQTYNFNSMSEAHQPRLRDQILKNTYFKTLVKIDTFEGIMDEMYQYVETAETYGGGSTHAASVQFPTVPSSLFCCLYRLFTIGLSYDELNLLCESKDWPYIRCCGFLYIRFGCAPEKLWDFLGEYCVDDQEFEPSKSTPGFVVTIGEYVESLLLDERYYYSTLPRIPVGVKKKIEEKVAPLGQYRKRAAQNKDMLSAFKEAGTPVE